MSGSDVRLSTEQADVVFSLADRLSVVAAAGSGKTLVLVQRYLRHVLEEGIHPDRILTITFTRKAAAEMKSRIVAGLRKAGAWDQAQVAETGPIQTIHSLCEQLLRERAIVAGLDVKFEVLSDAQSSRYQFQAIEEALASANPDHQEAEALISRLAGQRSYGDPHSPYSRLRHSIRDALAQFRGAFVGPETPNAIYRDAHHFREHWQRTLLETQPLEILEVYEAGLSGDWRTNLKNAYRQFRRAAPTWLNDKINPGEDDRADRDSCGIAQIALEAWGRLEERMEEEQQFDFAYLEDRTIRMLRALPQLAESLVDRYEILMVDEAQDLNPKQHELVEFLGKKRLLAVGDDRQSIYGFRLADPTLFKTAYQSGAKRLSQNYRSGQGILNFVNRLFSEIWSADYQPTGGVKPLDLDLFQEEDYGGTELWELDPSGPASCAPYIRDLVTEGVAPGEICVLTRNTATCQSVQEALTSLGIPSRIHGGAEKFYTRMEVRDLANLLRCLADPYNDFSLLATLRSPLVDLSIRSMATLAAHPPVFDALSAGFVSPEDQPKLAHFLQWYQPIRAYADRVSAWEVLSRVLADTPLLKVLAERSNGQQQIANVRKLLVLATRDSHLGPTEFADQIRDIQELRHKEGDADEFVDSENAVRLMTIHKSKGLEFPVVVLPETNRKLDGRAPEIVFDPALQLMATHFSGLQGLLHRALAYRKKEREVAEELRVLYVAMTRAKERLCIGVYPTTSGDTFSKRVKKSFGDHAPESVNYRRLPEKE